MKNSYPACKLLLSGFLITLFAQNSFSQCQVNATATASIILTPSNVGGSTAMSIAYNPNQNLYYATSGGYSGTPIETFDGNTGSPLLSSPNAGHDWRGVWWNPLQNRLEGNPCSGCPSNGIRSQNLNGSGYALSTGTNILPIGQPNFQSQGAFDYISNEIIYYDNGRIYRYSGVTGAAISNYALTGLPVGFGNLNAYFTGFSGCVGQEIIVFDYINKRVYLCNKATGAYVATSQIPAGAPNTNSAWYASYANNRMFLFDGGNQWKSYQVVIPCVNPAAAGPITGPATVCQGQTGVMYSVASIAGATGYNWVLPPGATIVGNGNNDTITVDFGNFASSGNISVNGTQLQCSGTASSKGITVNPLPHFAGPNAISGPFTACQGGININYSITALANAIGYNWVLPAGVNLVAGANTNSITVDFSLNAVSGYIYVNGTNNCGSGEKDSLFVGVTVITVNQAPFATVCHSDPAFGLSGGAPAGGVYTGPGITNNIFDPAAAGVGTHTITYTYTNPNTGCVGDTFQTITVVTPTVVFAPVSPLCLNATPMVLTQGTPNGGTYAGTGIVNSYTFDPTLAGAGSHLITYTYMDNAGCFNSDTETVWVNALPAVTFTPPVGACNTPIALSGGSPAGGTYSGIGVSNGMFNPQAPGAGQVTYTYTNPNTGCSNSSVQTINITQLPGAAGTITGPASVCQGDNGVAFSVASIANATGYNWVLPPGATIAAGANTNSISADFSNIAVSGSVTVGGTNSCGNGAISPNFTIVVDPLPIAGFTFISNQGVGQFNNTSQYGTGFVWNFGDGSPTSTSVSPQHVFPANNTYTVTLIATNACGSDTFMLEIVSNSGVGMNETINGQNLSIYPNPTKDQLNIKLEGAMMNSLEIKLVSANGQLVYDETVNNFSGSYVKSLSMAKEAKGIYFLQFISEKQVITKKVVLE